MQFMDLICISLMRLLLSCISLMKLILGIEIWLAGSNIRWLDLRCRSSPFLKLPSPPSSSDQEKGSDDYGDNYACYGAC